MVAFVIALVALSLVAIVVCCCCCGGGGGGGRIVVVAVLAIIWCGGGGIVAVVAVCQHCGGLLPLSFAVTDQFSFSYLICD